MRRILLNGLLSLAIVGGGVALAQAPGGGQSMPQQRPSSPDTNGPGATGPGTNSPDTMTQKIDDKKFAKNAALGGLAEVELGKLAQQKGASDGVKQFGQKMVDDHSKANDQLKEIATKENLDIPSALDSKHQSKIDKLSKLSGPAFDKAYVKDMLKDHEQDVNEFQLEAQNGNDPNIKQFAASTLPTLKDHLSMVKDLNKQEKSSSK
jgi:putative membrane protein